MKKFVSLFITLVLLVSLCSTVTLAFAEDNVAVTGVSFDKASDSREVGEGTLTVKATVAPSNATNKGVVYSMADESAGKGVTVDSSTGIVTIDSTAAIGEYIIVAASSENSALTARFTLKLTAPRQKIVFNEEKFWTYLDAENKNYKMDMKSSFMVSNEWLKDSAKVAEVFENINYMVEDDEGYKDEKDNLDKIYIEYRTPSEDPREEKWGDAKLVTSTFSVNTSGWWTFRYLIKDKNDKELARSSSFVRYAEDLTNPVVDLSDSMKNKAKDGLTSGITYSISTSLSITDSSSTTVTYIVEKLVKGVWTKIYDSESKEVTKGYENNISTSGVITPVDNDINKDKTPVYKITYTVVDSYGFEGVSSGENQVEFHPELLLFVNAPEGTEKQAQKIEAWKIVLYVIAGLSAVGIVVLLCIKPKQATETGTKVNYNKDSDEKEDESQDNK